MTRDEANKKLVQNTTWHRDMCAQMVIALEAIGLLHLETTEDKVRLAAVSRLVGVIAEVTHSRNGVTDVREPGRITHEGALEILDVLTKSGFRISRE